MEQMKFTGETEKPIKKYRDLITNYISQIEEILQQKATMHESGILHIYVQHLGGETELLMLMVERFGQSEKKEHLIKALEEIKNKYYKLSDTAKTVSNEMAEIKTTSDNFPLQIAIDMEQISCELMNLAKQCLL